MVWLFNTVIYQPLLNALVYLYGLAGSDLGIAIIIMTVFIRALSLPLSLKMLRSQRQMSELGPEMERIKKQHKDDQATQGQAMMALYKERGVNPLSGCLPLLIQIPVLLGLYRVFLNVFKPDSLGVLYSFIPSPETINTITVGFFDLSVRSIPLALAAGAAQFIHARYARPTEQAGQTGQMAMMSKQMLYFFPLMIIIVSWNLPAGLALYWVISTLMSIGEQVYIRKTTNHVRTTA